MKNFLPNSILHSCFNLRNKKSIFSWISLIFIIKLFIFFIFYNLFPTQTQGEHAGVWGLWAGDTEGYLNPIENFFKTFGFKYDYRTPGYGLPYFIFRIFLPEKLALNFLLIFQIFIASISQFLVGKLILDYTKKGWLFILSNLIYFSFWSILIMDWFYLPQSLVISSTIISFYYLIKFVQTNRKKDLFISGIFLAYIIYLYPINFFTLFPLLLILFIKRKSFIDLIRIVIVFSIPMVFCSLLWITHNYYHFKKIALSPVNYTVAPQDDDSYIQELNTFTRSYGGDMAFWQFDSENRWFLYKEVKLKDGNYALHDNSVPLPDDIYTNDFTIDSLEKIRDAIKVIETEPNLNSIEKNNLIDFCETKLTQYNESFKKEHPSYFHIKSRFKTLVRFLSYDGVDEGTLAYKKGEPIIKKMIRIYSRLLYLTILWIGIVGSIFLFFCSNISKAINIFNLSFVLINIITFAFLLKLVEHRYYVCIFPFLIISTIRLINYFTDRYNKTNN